MFDDDILDKLHEEEVGKGKPVLVCWYSGGFTAEDGIKTLSPVVDYLKKNGIEETLILHHSNEYGFTGEGYEPWPQYIDRCVEEIDKAAAGRPLFLLGHSKGCCPALSMATRLGTRVLKVYLLGTMSWLPKHPTPWEKLSKDFKKGGDKQLIGWLASLQPSNVLLTRAAILPDDEFNDAVEGSKLLKTMVNLLRLQYQNAMFPDMKNKVIDVFPADVCAFPGLQDAGSRPPEMEGFRRYTKGRFNMHPIDAGHIDILTNAEMHGKLCADMLEYM